MAKQDRQAYDYSVIRHNRICDLLDQEVWFIHPLTGRWRKGTILAITKTKGTVLQANNSMISIYWEELYS